MSEQEYKKKFQELEAKYNHVFGNYNKRIINRTKQKLLDINWKPLVVIPVVAIVLNLWRPSWIIYTEKELSPKKELIIKEKVHQSRVALIAITCYIIIIAVMNYTDIKHFLQEQFNVILP